MFAMLTLNFLMRIVFEPVSPHCFVHDHEVSGGTHVSLVTQSLLCKAVPLSRLRSLCGLHYASPNKVKEKVKEVMRWGLRAGCRDFLLPPQRLTGIRPSTLIDHENEPKRGDNRDKRWERTASSKAVPLCSHF